MSSARRMWFSVIASAILFTGFLVAPNTAQADPARDPEPSQDDQTTQDDEIAQLPEPIEDVPPVDPGPDDEFIVDREPSKATQQIDPLPALAPDSGSPDVDIAPVTPEPPVAPEPLELPARPAQELIDATAEDALTTIDDAGYVDAGRPNLDANQLQPQVSTPQVIDDTRPATLEELIEALLSGNLPPDLGVDPLALLEQLPDGIPRITYRVCSESETKEVSCSLTLPLGVPAIADVTGDGTPDVLADLLPAAALGDVTAAVEELLEIQDLLDEAQTSLDALLALMEDPLWLLQNPWAIVEALRLEELVGTLTADLAEKLEALLGIIHLGLAFLEVRLPTSEYHGEDLPAHVWAVYDIPGGNRLSVGYDGYHRGTSVSGATLGLFTFSPLQAIAGEYDINATLLQAGAGDAMAVTAGLSQVADTEEGEAINPTVASARFSPVPTVFTAHAAIDPGGDGIDQRASVEASSNVETHLDTIVMINDGSADPPTDRYVQLDVNMLPTEVAAELTWTPEGDHAVLDYDASSGIDNVLFADYTYTDATLIQATQATATEVPAIMDADLSTTAENRINLDYSADSRLESLAVNYYDAGGEIVLRGGLTDLPTALNLFVDPVAGQVNFTGQQALGQATVAASLHLGDFAPLSGDHATLVTADPAVGVSAQVSGMQSVDAYFDGHPRLTTVFDPGGQPFVGAGELDGVHQARLDISNLPAEASLDIDTAEQELLYRASDIIDLARVDYTNTASGPTVVAAVHELPQSVQLGYELGDRPQLLYEASSSIPLLEFFASLDHIENLQPQSHHYLSAEVTDLPATIDFLIDLPARHMRGTMDSDLGGVDTVARFPLEGRDWTAMADLDGVPAEFDADWAGGTVRMRGISGPLASVDLAAANHPNPTAPNGLRLAAHYREVTGDIDAAVATRNLSHVEYSDTENGQNFRLETDTEGRPLFVDVDVLLADPDDPSIDDIQLALLGRIDNLPATLNVGFADGRLVYTADRNIGLELEARLGKVAALDGFGAPLFDNGVAAVARTCDTGPGCAADQTPFCVAAGCVGLVGTVSLPGLPTEVVVDTADGTVNLTGYRPPADPLQAYVRLIGLIDSLPDLRAQATLSGLPSPVDFTLGPVDVNGATIDVGYTASAPLGDLRLDADVRTTNADFPVVRGRATVTGLPATMAVSGEFGPRTVLGMHNSAAVDEIGLTVTDDTQGYLRATVDDVPADVDVIVDVPASHLEGQMSAPLGGIELLAQNMPYDGDTWGAYAALTGIPGQFDADWAGGEYRVRGITGPLGTAEVAVTNHAGAMAPTGSHLAVHYRQASGRIDGSASVSDVSLVEYGTEGGDQVVTVDVGAQTVALDADVVWAVDGDDDTRLAVTGFVDAPTTLNVTISDDAIDYSTEPNVGLQLQARVGKVAALQGLGTPIFDNGVAARVNGCDDEDGPGCSDNTSGLPEPLTAFCDFFDSCWGAVASVNLPGLPASVSVDLGADSVTIEGLQSPGQTLEAFIEVEDALDAMPRTAGKIDLTGLPATLDLTVGPFRYGSPPDDDDPPPPEDDCDDDGGSTEDPGKRGQTTFTVQYSASAPLGTLTAHMDAETRDTGDVAALLEFNSVPQTAYVTGYFGDSSLLYTNFAEPVDELSVRATGTGFIGDQSTTGSALAQLTDVPASMALIISGFAADEDFGVPVFDYIADGDTLDGLVEVEADLVEAFTICDIDGAISVAGNGYAGFTNLAPQTSLSVDGTAPVLLTSGPDEQDATDEFFVGASISSAFPRQEEEFEVFDQLGFVGTFTVGYGVPTIEIENVRLSLTDVSRLELYPGVATGVRGDYGQLDFSVDEVLIDPQVDASLSVSFEGIGVELWDASLHQEFTGVRFHLSDLQMRPLVDVPIVIPTTPPVFACAAFETLPSRQPGFEPTENQITVDGADGPQVINYIDPIFGEGDLPEIPPELAVVVIDLLTVFVTYPFEGVEGVPQADWDVTLDLGLCTGTQGPTTEEGRA